MTYEISEADRILHSILSRDEKGRDEGIKPIVYKELYAPNTYGGAYYERLKDAVVVYKSYDITNSNGYKIGEEWFFCILYKYGGMTYSHHKRLPGSLERYIFEEEVANPLREDYNYKSIRDYIEDKNIDDEDKIELIRDMLNEYSKIFDKRGRWEEFYH